MSTWEQRMAQRSHRALGIGGVATEAERIAQKAADFKPMPSIVVSSGYFGVEQGVVAIPWNDEHEHFCMPGDCPFRD